MEEGRAQLQRGRLEGKTSVVVHIALICQKGNHRSLASGNWCRTFLQDQGFVLGKATEAPYPMKPERILRQAGEERRHVDHPRGVAGLRAGSRERRGLR